MKNRTRMYRSIRHLATTTCLSAAMIAAPFVVQANPVGGTVSAGGAVISSSGNKTSITQTSDRAVIDWHGFDIGAGETTQFYQPSSSSVTLNRVGGSGPSVIDGQLLANGNIFIINPNGVLFGAHSHVDVNGLVASTADVSNANFMAGKFILDIAGNPNASVINRGTITARQAGLVGLVAPNVVNSGIITARLGRVHLASGDTATVDLYGDGLLEVAVSDKVKSQLVSNTGIISADGGTIALTAAAGRSVVNSLISVEGELTAPAVTEHAGKIIIYAADGAAPTASTARVSVSGTLNVSGRRAGETGGTVTITGTHVALTSQARIDADGSNGGGTIAIGGGLHGTNNTIANAQDTDIAAGALIAADALSQGNGGTISVWSNGTTNYAGTISARGGLLGGHGGFVETSGKQSLAVKGTVDLTASHGAIGTWLLDPTNITIRQYGLPSDGVNIFSTLDIQNMSTSANVSLLADNDITLDMNGTNIALSQNRDLTLTATNGNITNTSLGAISATGTGNITLNAGGVIDVTNLFLYSGHQITTTSVGDTVLGQIQGKIISATATGAGSRITTDTIAAGTGGNITLTSDDITIGGNLSGTGTLLLQQHDPHRDMDINYGTADGTNYNLSTAEIALAQNGGAGGWSSIQLGLATAPLNFQNVGSSNWFSSLTLNSYYEHIVGNLDVNGSITMTNNNVVNFITGSLTTHGQNITLGSAYLNNNSITTNGGDITVLGGLGLVSGNVGPVNLSTSGGDIAIGGTITDYYLTSNDGLIVNAGSGHVSFGGAIDTGAELRVTGGAISFAGAIGSSVAPSQVWLNSTGSMVLPDITATNFVVLASDGTVTQTGALIAPNFYLGGTGNYILTNSGNHIQNMAADTGSFTLANGNFDLNIGSNAANGVRTTGNVDINVGTGTLTDYFGITTGAGNLTITADNINILSPLTGTGILTLKPFTAGRYIAVNAAPDDGSNFNISTAEIANLTRGWHEIDIGDPNAANPIIFGNAHFLNTVNFASNGAIISAGDLVSDDGVILNFTANGGISLTNSVTARNNVDVFGIINYGVQTITSTNGNITLHGDAGNGVSLEYATITLQALHGTIDIVENVIGGSITAVGNRIITEVPAWSGMDHVSLTSTLSLSLPSIDAINIFARTTGLSSDIILGAGVTLSASDAGNAITLASTHNFINNSGSATPFTLTGGGRWLVYSRDAAGSTTGGLVSDFTVKSCAFATPGTCAYSPYTNQTATIDMTGNGFIYTAPLGDASVAPAAPSTLLDASNIPDSVLQAFSYGSLQQSWIQDAFDDAFLASLTRADSLDGKKDEVPFWLEQRRKGRQPAITATPMLLKQLGLASLAI